MSPASSMMQALYDTAVLSRPLCLDIGGTLKYLAYRPELLDALREVHERGRKIVLVTPLDADSLQQTAAPLELFDAVHHIERRGLARGDAERAVLLTAYGAKGFDYLSDALVERQLAMSACRVFLLQASSAALKAAHGLDHVVVVSRQPSMIRALIKQLRPHQWAKNALVLLPVFLAPKVPGLSVLMLAFLAALTFSLCASAGYVFNDLLDIEADRMHATKYTRPFASGALPTAVGPPLFLALLAISFGVAWALMPGKFLLLLALYFIGTLAYSLYLKRLLMLDVLVLAGLYTHRILAGGYATGVKVSTWLLGFSMFLFTSLAFAKRYVELRPLSGDTQVRNRGYSGVDIDMVASMGTASGFISALVFMLYVDSAAVRDNYREPVLLWLVLPILLFWLGRIWLLTGRGQMRDDPVKFALTDGISVACAIAIALVAAAARYTPILISSGVP